MEDKDKVKHCVPFLLQTFLESIVGDEIKQIAIGHFINNYIRLLRKTALIGTPQSGTML
jgi:hypothetical protein